MHLKEPWWVPLVLVAACHDKTIQVTREPSVDATSQHIATPETTGETDMDDFIRNHLARLWSVDGASITLKYPVMVAIPGARLFHARAGAPAERGGHELNGLATTTGLFSGPEAYKLIAAAWNYGPNSPVPAADVAQALAHVFDARHQSSAIASDLALGSFKRVVSPATAAAAILPEALEIDGRPAVRFVMQSSKPRFRASMATAIFQADGSVDLRLEPLP
jgi:hypothetical protein